MGVGDCFGTGDKCNDSWQVTFKMERGQEMADPQRTVLSRGPGIWKY